MRKQSIVDDEVFTKVIICGANVNNITISFLHFLQNRCEQYRLREAAEQGDEAAILFLREQGIELTNIHQFLICHYHHCYSMRPPELTHPHDLLVRRFPTIFYPIFASRRFLLVLLSSELKNCPVPAIIKAGTIRYLEVRERKTMRGEWQELLIDSKLFCSIRLCHTKRNEGIKASLLVSKNGVANNENVPQFINHVQRTKIFGFSCGTG